MESWARDEDRGYRLSFSEGRTGFTYWLDQYAPPLTSNGYAFMAMNLALDYQMYSGIPPEERFVSYTIYDVEKGEVFYRSVFPPDRYGMYPPDMASGVPVN